MGPQGVGRDDAQPRRRQAGYAASRRENVEEAIRCYRAAIDVRDRDSSPDEWAMTHNDLGIAYNRRTRGDRAENLERAIGHYRAAVSVRPHR